jgi:predicted MFS family arabinose efflux permease
MLTALFPSRRDRAILFPAIGAQLLLGTTSSLLPVFLETLEDKAGLTVRGAGFLLSGELAAASLTTLLVTGCKRHHSARKWALIGGAIAIFGTLLTLLSPALHNLVFSRLLAGIGTGIVGAEALKVLARGVDKDRLIAMVTIASMVNAALWFALIPLLVELAGYRAIYLCLCMVFLVGAALLTRLLSPPERSLAALHPASARFSARAVIVVAAIFLTQLGQGAFWSLEETFGKNAGFSPEQLGWILALSTLLLLAGAGGAAWAGDRFGQAPTLLTLIALNLFSILIIGTVKIPAIYLAANLLQSLTNLSSLVYQLGLSANLDRFGRAVAAGTAMVTLGNGVGPSLPAWLSGWCTMQQVAVLVTCIDLIAWLLFATVLLRKIEPVPVATR